MFNFLNIIGSLLKSKLSDPKLQEYHHINPRSGLTMSNSILYPTVSILRGHETRVKSGHLWIFSNELEQGFQELPPGSIVNVLDFRHKFIGIGTINPHSLIAVRILSFVPTVIDEEFLTKKLFQITRRRERWIPDWTIACRLIYGDADGLPGLIVDRFSEVLVIQTTTAGMEQLLPLIVKCLSKLFSPRAIIAANDVPIRSLEGLPLYRSVLAGQWDGLVSFEQDGISLIADPLQGQKTGYFLDQQENRRLLAKWIKPESTVLDLFCCAGGFGLYLLAAGAAQITFVDASESALSIVREAVARNGWPERARFVKADIFDWIKNPTEQFDVVILDPPALAKSRAKVGAALRAYRDLNARAMQWVLPGGLLATSSCSGLVTPEAWREALREASAKSGRSLRILAQGHQAPDHPILVVMPETEYLKFAVLEIE
jgi:23S rRNA (cytosine1962-C5)-methyltransferase